MADKKPTRREVEDWPTIREAQKRAEELHGEFEAHGVVWDRVRDGFIQTIALRSSTKIGRNGIPTIKDDPTVISTGDWAAYDGREPETFLRGEAIFIYRAPGPQISYVDIRLNPEHVDREFPRLAVTVIDAPSRNPRGAGAPVKPWWESFWIEMACRVYAGDIQPTKTQAEIVRVMLDWASKNDKELGETLAKEKAKKILEALKKPEVGN